MHPRIELGKQVRAATLLPWSPPQSLYEALAEHLGAQEHIAALLTDNHEYPIRDHR